MARVLLIDDEDMVRQTLGMALKRAGHDVVLAADGTEGVQLLGLHGADVVITDIIMPNKEGIETIAEIRVAHPQVPIIAISGGGRTSNFQFLDLARRLGAGHVLRKPFRTAELLKVISECVVADA